MSRCRHVMICGVRLRIPYPPSHPCTRACTHIIPCKNRKGTNGPMGSELMASPQILSFFDRGTFWVLPLTYTYLPKSARAYLFPQSARIHYFCSGPLSVDPICPQANKAARRPEPKMGRTRTSERSVAALTERSQSLGSNPRGRPSAVQRPLPRAQRSAARPALRGSGVGLTCFIIYCTVVGCVLTCHDLSGRTLPLAYQQFRIWQSPVYTSLHTRCCSFVPFACFHYVCRTRRNPTRAIVTKPQLEFL